MQIRLRFISLAVLVVSILMLAISFATARDGGRTRFGSDLGADHVGFYTAGWILNHHRAVDLYDNPFQDQVHHQLHPHLEPETTLPYVHPPFVAVAFRPFACLPYAWSFALWLVVCFAFYLAGALVLLRTTAFTPSERWTALLAMLAFEPFVLECWQGGQLSAVGFCFIAIGVALDLTNRRFQSGLSLGLCLYKPTLLIVIVPFLFATRRWRTLVGLTVTGVSLALLSVVSVGWDGTMAFVHQLLGFSKQATSTSQLEFKTWKYVDLNAFTRLLTGGPGTIQQILFVTMALPALGYILIRSRQNDGQLPGRTRLMWASVLLATPVINLYVGMYDSVLAALGAILLIDGCRRGEAARERWIVWTVGALYVTPWVTQPAAQAIHVQAFTLILLGAGLWTASLKCRLTPNPDYQGSRA